ncbi:WD40 repeat domain-containing protein [Lysobacter sp. CA199]|uniref:WD40 repeat domain-containing protein n=1 Tax=Lysobacter sp. CA199 TaxID=3455608 RepID=UPI003F8CFBC7
MNAIAAEVPAIAAGQASSNPFVGPVPIDFGQPLHGRNREIEELSDLLVSKRIVLLFSPSGAGKTSLVRAGVIPRLRDEYGIDALPIVRLGHCDPEFANDPGLNRYRLATLSALERARAEVLRKPCGELGRYTLKQYIDEYAFAAAGESASGHPSYPLLVFDQFEELFTFNPLDQEQKHQFLTELGDLLRGERINPWAGDSAVRIWALFIIREDRLAELQSYLDLIPTSLAYRYRLEALSVEAATDAIVRTAGERWMESGVAESLVGDLSTVRIRGLDGHETQQPGRFVEPVQLQVVCRDLWQKIVGRQHRSIRLEDVQSIEYNQVDRALRDFIDAEIAAAAHDDLAMERRLRDWMESKLISTAGVRTPCLYDDEDGQDVRSAIARLIEAHLLRLDKRSGRDWVELPHDRLVTPIRESNRVWRQTHLQFFQMRAERWYQCSGANADTLLLSTHELKVAEAYLAAHEQVLPPSDDDFLRASRQRREVENRQRRWRRLLIVLAAVCAVAVVALIVFYTRSEADEAQRAARSKAYRALSLAREKQDTPGRTLRALIPLMDDANSRDFGDDGGLSRTIEDELRQQLTRAPAALKQELRPRGYVVWSLAFTQDGKRLIAGSWDNRISVQNVDEPGSPEFITPGQKADIYAVAVYGSRVVSTDREGQVTLWKLDETHRLRVMRVLLKAQSEEDRLAVATFSEDGRWLAVAGWNKQVLMWDFADPDNPVPAPAFGRTLSSMLGLAFLPTTQGYRLVSADTEGNLRRWRFDDATRHAPILEGEYSIQKHTGYNIAVTTLAADPRGSYIVAGDTDGSVHLWDMRADDKQPGIVLGHLTHRGRGRDTYVKDIDFLGPGDFVTVGADGSLVRWTLPDETITNLDDFPKKTRREHFSLGERLYSVTHRPGSRAQVAVGATHKIVLLDLDRGTGPAMASPLPGARDFKAWTAVSMDTEGKSIAARGEDQLRFWRRGASGIEAAPEWSMAVDEAAAFAWRPDGRQFVVWDCRSLSAWTLENGKRPAPALQVMAKTPRFCNEHRPPEALPVMSFSQNSRLLATTDRNVLHMWTRDAATDTHWRQVYSRAFRVKSGTATVTDRILSVAFSEDSRYLAAGTDSGHVHLWEVSTDGAGAPHLELLRDAQIGQGVSALVFSRNKNELLAGGIEGFLTKCELPTLKPIGVIRRHDHAITALANARGGERSITISADSDGYVVEWSAPLNDAERISTTELEPRASGVVQTVALNGEGTFLISAGASLLGWDLGVDRVVDAAKAYVARSRDDAPSVGSDTTKATEQ